MSFGEGAGQTAAATASTTGRLESQGVLRFPAPKSFDGNEEMFETFAYKLRAYMGLADPRFRALMNGAKERTEPIDFDALDEDTQVLAAQLHNALSSLCEGIAGKIVTRDEDS